MAPQHVEPDPMRALRRRIRQRLARRLALAMRDALLLERKTAIR